VNPFLVTATEITATSKYNNPPAATAATKPLTSDFLATTTPHTSEEIPRMNIEITLLTPVSIPAADIISDANISNANITAKPIQTPQRTDFKLKDLLLFIIKIHRLV
jgi:hypothetical protein